MLLIFQLKEEMKEESCDDDNFPDTNITHHTPNQESNVASDTESTTATEQNTCTAGDTKEARVVAKTPTANNPICVDDGPCCSHYRYIYTRWIYSIYTVLLVLCAVYCVTKAHIEINYCHLSSAYIDLLSSDEHEESPSPPPFSPISSNPSWLAL